MMLRIFFLLSTLAATSAWSVPRTKATSFPAVEPPASEAISRRNLLASVAVLGASSMFIDPLKVNAADNNALVSYQDPECNFQMMVPADWDKSVQTLPDRRKIVLYIKPNSDKKTLLFFAYTPIRDDFTSLGSFGSVDEVAYATILPKGEIAGVQGVESKMLSAESKKSAYYFDYVQTVPGQPETHFQTIFTLKQAGGGAGNVLVTITAQAPESEYGSLKTYFDEIINSFK